MSESPLETTRRVWPGEWTLHRGFLHLILCYSAELNMSIAVFAGGGKWSVMLNTPGVGNQIASDPDLAEALTVARRKVIEAVKELARNVGEPKETT